MGFKFKRADGSLKTSATVNAPAGAIMDFAGASAPDGWLICDGSVVSQAAYSNLYAVIGATYNTGGEGAGNFRLPDTRGRVTIHPDAGAGRITSNNTLAATSGVESVALSATQLPTHTHGAGTYAAASHSHPVGTLTVDSHSHGAGSYTMPNHSHGGAGITVNVLADNAFSATQSGSGVNRANATHSHSATVGGNTGNLVAAAITGTSGGSGASISGSSGNTSPAVTGSSGSTLTEVAPGSGHGNVQPYIVFNKIIKH